MRRALFDHDHEAFRDAFRTFVAREVTPHHHRWECEGIVPREVWRLAGKAGYLGMAVPEVYGGMGVEDFRYNVVIAEELAAAGASGPGFSLHTDIALPYLLSLATDEQRARWLPGVVAGESILAIAMTEPGTGSDLSRIATTAIPDGDEYVLNGAKTFITNGINADLVIVAVKTNPAARGRGMSLLVVERGMPGFTRGRRLAKLGMHAQDTAELFFDDVRVPGANLLGRQGRGFPYLVDNLPQERLAVAVGCVAGARAALDQTVEYAKQRHAFGQPIGSFQHNRFTLAELATELELAGAFVDRCVQEHCAGRLTIPDAAMAKVAASEMFNRTVDRCLQLYGGYGYMTDSPIARTYLDARVQTIYAGTSEIMKDIIGRSLGV